MKKTLTLALTALITTGTAQAQSAIDAYSLGQSDMRGTARFMGMAGAFTALGGDMSAINQNPAALGVYKYSEIGATMDIDIQSIKTMGITTDQTKVYCPNVGYVGTWQTGSDDMPYFSWSVSYGRTQSFDRRYGNVHGNGTYNPLTLNGSLTNYVAAYTENYGWPASDLNGYNGADPYYNTDAPWMSILMYNAYGINPTANTDDCSYYEGLYNGTAGEGTFDVEQRGYVDQYNISFGGNVQDKVYWGIGFGIYDIEFTNNTYYSEYFSDALISNASATGFDSGYAALGLQSWKHMWGTGFDFKAGVIVKPISELRLGLTVHTPTYYDMNYESWAQTDFSYGSGIYGWYPSSGENAPTESFSWKYRTPMRLEVGAATVIDRKAILSLDYEWRPYSHMNCKNQRGQSLPYVNDDMSMYYKDQSTVRLGLEYRIDNAWTARAGFCYQTSPVTNDAREGNVEVFTDGPYYTETQPSYVLDKDTYYLTLGLGWHYQNFYLDATYVYRHRAAEFWSYTNYSTLDSGAMNNFAPVAELADRSSRIVLSAGFKF